jgi:hypothetical protein
MKYLKSYNESIRHLLKPKDEVEVSKNIEIRDNIYKQQYKCKYNILRFLESIDFKFDYPIELNEEPGWFDRIGDILITDFIKEHKKIIPNFNNLSHSKQDEEWDNSINNIIKPKIEEILNQFNFKLNDDGFKYGQGDLLLEFSTPYDDLLKFSKDNFKIVSDKFLKK